MLVYFENEMQLPVKQEFISGSTGANSCIRTYLVGLGHEGLVALLDLGLNVVEGAHLASALLQLYTKTRSISHA